MPLSLQDPTVRRAGRVVAEAPTDLSAAYRLLSFDCSRPSACAPDLLPFRLLPGYDGASVQQKFVHTKSLGHRTGWKPSVRPSTPRLSPIGRHTKKDRGMRHASTSRAGVARRSPVDRTQSAAPAHAASIFAPTQPEAERPKVSPNNVVSWRY